MVFSANNQHSVQKPLILSVETSGRTGSIALALGRELIEEQVFSAPMRHSAELFAAAERILNQYNYLPSQIAQIHISIGPGSFTGIRIAVTVAKVMSFANYCNIIAVNTLDALALNALDFAKDSHIASGRFAVVLDAKRGQFFAAVYALENGLIIKTTPDMLIEASEFLKLYTSQTIFLLGEGLVFYIKQFEATNVTILDSTYWHPRASKILQLGSTKAMTGQFEDPLRLVPHYLRGPDAVQKPELKELFGQ